MKKSLICAVIIIFILTLGSVALAAESAQVPTINVSGEASMQVPPDTAQVTFAVETVADSVADAQSISAQKTSGLMAALLAAGIKQSDITTNRINVYPQYNQNSDKIMNYRMENSVRVEVQDLTALGNIIDQALRSGANRVDGLDFTRKNMADYADQVMLQAVADAQHKAAVLAKGFGVSVGQPLSIGENRVSWRNSVQPNVALFKMDGAAASTPVEPGLIEVSAAVNVTYAIQ